jgi:hypothetical protein
MFYARPVPRPPSLCAVAAAQIAARMQQLGNPRNVARRTE